MRFKDILVVGLLVISSPWQVLCRPQQPPVETEGPLTLAEEDQNDAMEFQTAQTEPFLTEDDLTDITETNNKGTEAAQTTTDLMESDLNPDHHETSPDHSQAETGEGDIPEISGSEIEVSSSVQVDSEMSETKVSGGEVPKSEPSEGEMSETKMSESEASKSEPSEGEMSQMDPSEGETEISEGEVSVSEDDMFKDEVVFSETDRNHENAAETKPDHTDKTETKHSETNTKPSETGMTESRPDETMTETKATENRDQTKPSVVTPSTARPSEAETKTRPSETKETRPTQKPKDEETKEDQASTSNSKKDQKETDRPAKTKPDRKHQTGTKLGGDETGKTMEEGNGSDGETGRPENKETSPDRDLMTNETSSCRIPGVEYPLGITFDELRAALEEARVLLIDIRQPWELMETGRLPWSYNLPLPEIEEAVKLSENSFMERYGFPKPMPEDNNIVLTCRSGRRIRRAWELLEPLGYCNLRLYFGSYLEWKRRGGPLLPFAPIRRSF